MTPLCLLSLADPRIQSNNRYLKINNKIIPQEFLFILLFPPFFSATKQSFNQNHCSKIKIKLQKHNFKKKKKKARVFIYSFIFKTFGWSSSSVYRSWVSESVKGRDHGRHRRALATRILRRVGPILGGLSKRLRWRW